MGLALKRLAPLEWERDQNLTLTTGLPGRTELFERPYARSAQRIHQGSARPLRRVVEALAEVLAEQVAQRCPSHHA